MKPVSDRAHKAAGGLANVWNNAKIRARAGWDRFKMDIPRKERETAALYDTSGKSTYIDTDTGLTFRYRPQADGSSSFRMTDDRRRGRTPQIVDSRRILRRPVRRYDLPEDEMEELRNRPKPPRVNRWANED
jgi:hypothetical protein